MVPSMREQPEPIAGGTSILQKLLAVMEDCGYIQKDKENTFHRYWYASEAAIKDRVHKALVEHRVIPQVSLLGLTEREITRFKDGKPQTPEWLTTANVHYKFYCVDTGEFIEGTFYGCGVDPSDKGLYKAITGAIKYLLTSQFLIPTGDDPENEDGRTASKEEKKGKQEEYLRSKGIDPAPPATKPETIRELSDKLDEPPQKDNFAQFAKDAGAVSVQSFKLPQGTKGLVSEIEMRHAKQVAEADAILKDVKKPPARKKGTISFEALKSWGKLKDDLRELTGADTLYYQTLKAKGYEHADEISSEADAKSIFGVLGVERNRLKQNAELTQLLSISAEVIGQRAFSDLLGAHGAIGVAEVLAMGSDPLQALLTELKALVDARQATNV